MKPYVIATVSCRSSVCETTLMSVATRMRSATANYSHTHRLTVQTSVLCYKITSKLTPPLALVTNGLSLVTFARMYRAKQQVNKYASYPDWRMSPHADRRYRPVYHTWIATVQCVTNMFHFLALGLTPGPKFCRIGDDPLSSTILPNFTALRQHTSEIYVTKDICRRTDRQTDISACGDKK